MNATTPLPLHNRIHDIAWERDRHAAVSAPRAASASPAPLPMPIPPSRRPLAFLDAYYASERAEMPL